MVKRRSDGWNTRSADGLCSMCKIKVYADGGVESKRENREKRRTPVSMYIYVAKIPKILNDGRFLSPSSPTSSHST